MTEPEKINKLHEDLITSEFNPFPTKGKSVEASKKQGVYIIYSPTNIVLHVGTTKDGKDGLNQRLNNHRYGSSSFSNKYLKPKNKILCNQFKFKYIVVKNARTRALLEALTTGLLCPKHIGTGKKKKL